MPPPNPPALLEEQRACEEEERNYCGERIGSRHCVEMRDHLHDCPHIWVEGHRSRATILGMIERRALDPETMTDRELAALAGITMSLTVVRYSLEHDAGWTETWQAPSDEFRHVEGLPGISEKCWADVWEPEENADTCPVDDCPHGEYRVCNADAVTDLGTCANHQLT